MTTDIKIHELACTELNTCTVNICYDEHHGTLKKCPLSPDFVVKVAIIYDEKGFEHMKIVRYIQKFVISKFVIKKVHCTGNAKFCCA